VVDAASPALLEALDSVLAQLDGWPGSPASAAVVDRRGLLATRGPVGLVRPLASVTKLLTALGVHVAVGEGLLELDEPAGPPGSTVRHLLAHASGLGPERGSPVASSPGRRRIYSNAGYDELGSLVAERAQMAFSDYVRAGVLEVVGMATADVPGSPAASGTGALSDLVALARELLGPPRCISERQLEELRTVQFPGIAGVLPGLGSYEACDWGLGPEIRGAKMPHWSGTRCSAASFGHFGRSGSFVLVDPTVGLAVVGLSGEAFGPWALLAWPALIDAVWSLTGGGELASER
jgi:CubicO group peptidase (beta-lactamase class C family)